jgi:hypothetical protein
MHPSYDPASFETASGKVRDLSHGLSFSEPQSASRCVLNPTTELWNLGELST